MIEIFRFNSLHPIDFLNDRKVFVFKKLKQDLEEYKKIILNSKPNYILGLAKTRYNSTIESRAVNIFNKDKKVIKGKAESYDLFILNSSITVNNSYSDSFCNWLMYNIADFTYDKNLPSKFLFIHLNKKDNDLLKETINNLEFNNSV